MNEARQVPGFLSIQASGSGHEAGNAGTPVGQRGTGAAATAERCCLVLGIGAGLSSVLVSDPDRGTVGGGRAVVTPARTTAEWPVARKTILRTETFLGDLDWTGTCLGVERGVASAREVIVANQAEASCAYCDQTAGSTRNCAPTNLSSDARGCSAGRANDYPVFAWPKPLAGQRGTAQGMKGTFEQQLRRLLKSLSVAIVNAAAVKRRKPWELMIALEKKDGLRDDSRAPRQDMARDSDGEESSVRLREMIENGGR